MYAYINIKYEKEGGEDLPTDSLQVAHEDVKANPH